MRKKYVFTKVFNAPPRQHVLSFSWTWPADRYLLRRPSACDNFFPSSLPTLFERNCIRRMSFQVSPGFDLLFFRVGFLAWTLFFTHAIPRSWLPQSFLCEAQTFHYLKPPLSVQARAKVIPPVLLPFSTFPPPPSNTPPHCDTHSPLLIE